MAFDIRNMFVYIASFCIASCLTSGTQKKFTMLLQPKDLQDLVEQADICSKEAGFPPTALKKIVKWPISDARASKQLFQCVCYNTGYTDKDGHMVIEKFMSLKLTNGTQEELAKFLQECNKVTLEDAVETAYQMGDCLHARCEFAVERKTD